MGYSGSRRTRLWGGERGGRCDLADLFCECDYYAFGTAEVAQPIHILVLCYLAQEFGTVRPQTGDRVVDIVDGEHHAMQTERVGRRVRQLRGERGRRVVFGQL